MRHRQIGQISGPHLVRPIDRQAPQQIRADQRVARWNTGARPAVYRLDAHAAHPIRHVYPADLKSVPNELLGEPPCAIERMLQVQLIDPVHQSQILFAHRTRRVVDAAPIESENLALPARAWSAWVTCRAARAA